MAFYKTDITIGVDTDLEVHFTPAGTPVGWKTADGGILRPRIVFELESPEGCFADLLDEDAATAGISYDYADTMLIEAV